MNAKKVTWAAITYVLTFLIGVILFWSFGKDWLDLESIPIFIAGLVGVAVSVLGVGAWNTYRNSHHQDN